MVTFPQAKDSKAKGTLVLGTLFLTLPLTEENVLHHSHLVPEKCMLPSQQGLRENVRYLLISGYVLKLYKSSLNTISNEVVPNLYMLLPMVKHWILREFYATMIITVNHHCSQPLTKQTNQHLAKPYGQATSLTRCHILCLRRAQTNRLLLPTKPRHYCRTQTKATP